ncbi:MAG: integrase, partial [Pseudomonadales bacterium]
KNGAVVRKLFGYTHIPQRWAGEINAFNRDHLNPYLNFHRPCFFPVIVTNAKGKQRKRYPYEALMTPYEKLKSLPQTQAALNPDMSLEILDTVAHQISDNEAADRLQQARRKLFNKIYERDWKRA